MPVQWFTVQMALSDSKADGPTQFVPGSQRAGRPPNDPDRISFAGQGLVSVLCKAGDIYMQNKQCWHGGGRALCGPAATQGARPHPGLRAPNRMRFVSPRASERRSGKAPETGVLIHKYFE